MYGKLIFTVECMVAKPVAQKRAKHAMYADFRLSAFCRQHTNDFFSSKLIMFIFVDRERLQFSFGFNARQHVVLSAY